MSMISDQGLFRTGIDLMYGLGLRVLYFPGIDHIESRIDTGMMEALDLGHLSAKALFLSQLNFKPEFSPGKWHRQIQKISKVFKSRATLS